MPWNQGSKVAADMVWAAWCVRCQSYVVEEELYSVMRARFQGHLLEAHPTMKVAS